MTHRLTFLDHRRALDDNRYIYAVVSRRSRGLSIGVNLNPDKVCNFDCPYCQVDRTTPGRGKDVDLDVLEEELDRLLALVASGQLWEVPPFDTAALTLRRVNDIAFAGDGEPTSCPGFAEAVRRVGQVRARYGLDDVKINLLTNATLLHRPRVAEGLAELDRLGGEIWAKLDAGSPEYFRRVDGTALPFVRVLDNLSAAARARPIVLQCLFLTLDGLGPDEAEVAAWVGRIGKILEDGGKIRQVQVYSVARKPSDSSVGALPTARLEEIAEAARALGVDVVVTPGVA